MIHPGEERPYNSKPLILIVDDISTNLQLVGALLYQEGYRISMADSAEKVFDLLESILPDMILLDVMMPKIDGFELARKLKRIEFTKRIPIIFLTARADSDTLVESFKSGGIDYITKPFVKEELLARIETHLRLKFSRERIEKNISEIEKINHELQISNQEKDKYLKIINQDLQQASDYVQSLLPEKIQSGIINTDWIFEPSAKLGGDSLGYHWQDEDHFVMYLLDVSGHGVGSALQSVSALNMLRFQTMSNTDFLDPVSVLNSLNRTFQMPDHNMKYMSIWYGVYNKSKRELCFSSAGHPPGILICKEKRLLFTKNYAVGLFEDTNYDVISVSIDPGSRLYIYSDGLYEIKHEKSTVWQHDELMEFLHNNSEGNELIELYDSIKKKFNKIKLDDDASILKVKFN